MPIKRACGKRFLKRLHAFVVEKNEWMQSYFAHQ